MSDLEPIATWAGERPPDLTVLMPVRDSAPLVEAAVASVLAQEGCVAEILISDDQSSDGTLEAVRRTVAAWSGAHHVRLLRTTRRLAIDHLGALVAIAAAPLLVQAHGDDVSLPGRLARLLAIHRAHGPLLITSRVQWRRRSGLHEEPMLPGWEEGWLPFERFAAHNPGFMAGARYAIDRRVFDCFPRLDSAYLPIGHDDLQSFRAALLGGVWFCAEPLLVCTRHSRQWSMRLWDLRRPASRAFGFRLHRLGVLRAMLRDLAHAAEHGIVPAGRIEAMRTVLMAGVEQSLTALLDARDELHRQGLSPLWIEEQVLARSNLGQTQD